MAGKTKKTTSATPSRPQAGNVGKSNLKKLQINDPVNRNDKIMSALDKLGQKFIESEADRLTMKKNVDDNFNSQKEMERKLKRQMAKAEKLENQLNEAVQENERIRQNMDKSEKRQMRLQKRVERVESIASDAQAALEAKAMVLLTDRSIAHEAGMPYLSATGETPAIEGRSHGDALFEGDVAKNGFLDNLMAMPEGAEAAPWWKRRVQFSSLAVIGALVFAGLVGWGVSKMSSPAPQNAAFAIMQDGKLARIDLTTGQITPVMMAAKKAVQGQMSGDKAFKFSQGSEAQSAASITDKGVPVPASEKPSKTDEVTAADATDNAAEAQEDLAAAQLEEVELPLSERIQPDKNLPDELKELEAQAFEGSAEAQHDLAALYTAGQGVDQDYGRAAEWFREAAKADIANASYNLGVLYHQGLGVAQNMPMALDWYRRAALQGHPEAQYNLGIAYIEGIGAKYNPNMASAYFRQAALNGITEGAYNLGLILENGLLGQAYLEQAMVWYRAAADRGSNEAQNALFALADKLGVNKETAGLLSDDKSLAASMADLNDVQPAAGETANGPAPMPNVKADFDLVLADYIPSWDQIVLAEIQGQLTNLALYSGAQDGLIGPATAEAIKTFETIQGIEISGKPSQDLLMKMLANATKRDAS